MNALSAHNRVRPGRKGLTYFNPDRQDGKDEMYKLGIRTGKQYQKYKVLYRRSRMLAENYLRHIGGNI